MRCIERPGGWLAVAAFLGAGVPRTAMSEPRQAILAGGQLLMPLGEDGDVSGSMGGAIDLDLQPDDDGPLVLLAGGGAAFGLEGRGEQPERRDIYDLHFDVGLRLPMTPVAMPFVATGLNLLAVTSRRDDEVSRGTTLGANVQAGVASFLGRRWMLRFTATLLAGIVPGTGDDLLAIALSLAIGTGRAFAPEPEPTPPPPPAPPVAPPPSPAAPSGSTPARWLAGAASIALDCAAEQVAVESTTDERLGCGEMAAAVAGCEGALVYRRFVISGCGRRAELRCYVGSGEPSCVPAAGH